MFEKLKSLSLIFLDLITGISLVFYSRLVINCMFIMNLFCLRWASIGFLKIVLSQVVVITRVFNWQRVVKSLDPQFPQTESPYPFKYSGVRG